ncbi:MAG: flavin reductase family protein [Muribaculaceae bacterium]|nr:flavin reductase family protein [Muribaculaceae bacterium]
MKQHWKPGTMIYPAPAVLVSCGTADTSNFLTVAWTGTVCTNPAMCSISIRPERYSHSLIMETMEFTINLTTEAMARATDLAGVKSGRDGDKWKLTGLTPAPGVNVGCPMIEQSPLSIECRVTEVLRLGSHDMMIGRVMGVIADERYIDADTGKFNLERAGLIAYSHGAYYSIGEKIGHFGWSVKKK